MNERPGGDQDFDGFDPWDRSDRSPAPGSNRPGSPRRPARSRSIASHDRAADAPSSRPTPSRSDTSRSGTSRARAGGSAQALPPRPAETPTRALPVQRDDFPGDPRYADARAGSNAHAGANAHAASGARAGYNPHPQQQGHAPGLQHPGYPAPPQRPVRTRRRNRPLRLALTMFTFALVLVLGYGLGLTIWANSRIDHVDALSDRANTAGTTFLLAGSDARGDGAVKDDGTEGERADTLMLLHRARNGNAYLISLPRDTLVDIPGHGKYKLNAAFAFGGPKLLVETVEGFTGLTIDHYVQVGFDGIENLVNAVGGVNLCIDQDVDDERSGLKMTAGCHDVMGDQALAFVRARYFDPTADMGRQERQQQFVGALMDEIASPAVLINPIKHVRVVGAGSAALTTSNGTGVVALGRAALAARSAMKNERTPVMPVKDPAYQTKHSGVAVLTDDAEIAAFFTQVRDGEL